MNVFKAIYFGKWYFSRGNPLSENYLLKDNVYLLGLLLWIFRGTAAGSARATKTIIQSHFIVSEYGAETWNVAVYILQALVFTKFYSINMQGVEKLYIQALRLYWIFENDLKVSLKLCKASRITLRAIDIMRPALRKFVRHYLVLDEFIWTAPLLMQSSYLIAKIINVENYKKIREEMGYLSNALLKGKSKRLKKPQTKHPVFYFRTYNCISINLFLPALVSSFGRRTFLAQRACTRAQPQSRDTTFAPVCGSLITIRLVNGKFHYFSPRETVCPQA